MNTTLWSSSIALSLHELTFEHAERTIGHGLANIELSRSRMFRLSVYDVLLIVVSVSLLK